MFGGVAYLSRKVWGRGGGGDINSSPPPQPKHVSTQTPQRTTTTTTTATATATTTNTEIKDVDDDGKMCTSCVLSVWYVCWCVCVFVCVRAGLFLLSVFFFLLLFLAVSNTPLDKFERDIEKLMMYIQVKYVVCLCMNSVCVCVWTHSLFFLIKKTNNKHEQTKHTNTY